MGDNDNESKSKTDNELEAGLETLEKAAELREKLGGLPDKEGSSSISTQETQILKRADAPEQQPSEQEKDDETKVYLRPPQTPPLEEDLRDQPASLEDSAENPILSDAEAALEKLSQYPSLEEINRLRASEKLLEVIIERMLTLPDRIQQDNIHDIIAKAMKGEYISEADKMSVRRLYDELIDYIESFVEMEGVVDGKLPPKSMSELFKSYHDSHEATKTAARNMEIKVELTPDNIAKEIEKRYREVEKSKTSKAHLARYIAEQRNPMTYGYKREEDKEKYDEMKAELIKSLKDRFKSDKKDHPVNQILSQYSVDDDKRNEELDVELAEKIRGDDDLIRRFFGEGFILHRKIKDKEEFIVEKVNEIKEFMKKDPSKWLPGHITDLRTGDYKEYFAVNREIPELAHLWDSKSQVHYVGDEEHDRDFVDVEMAKIMIDNPEVWQKSAAKMLWLLHEKDDNEKKIEKKYSRLCFGLNKSGIVEILYRDAREARNEEGNHMACASRLMIARDIIDKTSDTKPEQYPLICAELGSDFLYLAKSMSDVGRKKTSIERSIENSKKAYKSASEFKNPSQEVKQAKAIASHNLNYGYNRLAELSKGEKAKEYKKEAGKYGSADKVKEELNIDIS